MVAALGPDLERPAAPEVRHVRARRAGPAASGCSGGRPASLARAAGLVRPRRGGRRRAELVAWTVDEAELLGVTGRGALSSSRPGAARRRRRRRRPSARAAPADTARPRAAAGRPHRRRPWTAGVRAGRRAVADGRRRVHGRRHGLPLHARRRSGAPSTPGAPPPTCTRCSAASSRTPVPQPLTYLVDDVARRHGQIRVGAASAYVRCDDEAVLPSSSPTAGRQRCGCAGSPRPWWQPQAPVDQVLDGLRAMGYAPAAEASDGTVVVRRPDARRTPAPPRPPRLTTEPSLPGDTLLGAAVRAMRAGERASRAPRGRTRRRAARRSRSPRSTTAETLAALKAAVESGRSLWIGYVDTHGGVSERVVDPIRLAGGYLTAFDHRAGGGPHLRRPPHHRRGRARRRSGGQCRSRLQRQVRPDPEGIA